MIKVSGLRRGLQLGHLQAGFSKDPLDVGDVAGPRREVERRVIVLARVVLASPEVIHPPEALELLKRAQEEASLPLHVQAQESRGRHGARGSRGVRVWARRG